MKNQKTNFECGKTMLRWYTAFLLLLAAAVVMMPVASVKMLEVGFILVVTGAAFWIGLIGTIVMSVRICRQGNKLGAASGKKKESRVGLIRFFQNEKAVVADVAMFVAAFGFVVMVIIPDNIYWLFVFLAMLIFSFGMHCMLNGAYYNQMIKEEKGE